MKDDEVKDEVKVVKPEGKEGVHTPEEIFQMVCPGCPWEKDKCKPCHLCR